MWFTVLDNKRHFIGDVWGPMPGWYRVGFPIGSVMRRYHEPLLD